MNERQAYIERAQRRLQAWDAKIEELMHQVHSRGRPKPSQVRALRRVLAARSRVLAVLTKLTSPRRSWRQVSAQMELAWKQLRATWKHERERLKASIATGCNVT